MAVLARLPVDPGRGRLAVLRHGLFDVDVVIRRTVVYATLTVLLGAAYAGLVLIAQGIFSSVAGGSDLAIAVSTLVVAALFLPVRAKVQGFVDRRFYRRRYDAQRTLATVRVAAAQRDRSRRSGDRPREAWSWTRCNPPRSRCGFAEGRR